jgi:hypothetical protein
LKDIFSNKGLEICIGSILIDATNSLSVVITSHANIDITSISIKYTPGISNSKVGIDPVVFVVAYDGDCVVG